MKSIEIAEICHEVNAEYCCAIGDNSQHKWINAPAWQKESALKGVEYHLNNPESKPEDSHNSWLAEKKATGWEYGLEKNAYLKEHPCYIPFKDLPQEQKAKDYIFSTIVKTIQAIETRNNRGIE